jgi:hypothetical protein
MASRHDGTSAGARLSASKAAAICRAFVPIADHIFDLMTQIKERGFTAFIPSLEFIASFRESPVEQELNRRCIVESAKEILGRPWPFKATNEEQELFFRSSLLEQLRKSRYKELGVSDAKSAAQLLAKSPALPTNGPRH